MAISINFVIVDSCFITKPYQNEYHSVSRPVDLMELVLSCGPGALDVPEKPPLEFFLGDPAGERQAGHL
jgi:hypothetical protein